MLVTPIATRSTAITRKPARSFVCTVARILRDEVDGGSDERREPVRVGRPAASGR